MSDNERVVNVGSVIRKQPGSESGITMIEVLITMVIVSVGLLGVAAMILNSVENNRSAYQRTQASTLAYDMADRIRANPKTADSYNSFNTDGASQTVPACLSSDVGCDGGKLAEADKAQWARSIEGTTDSASVLPDASGKIVRNGNEFLVTIEWTESQWDEGTSEVANQMSSFVLRFNL